MILRHPLLVACIFSVLLNAAFIIVGVKVGDRQIPEDATIVKIVDIMMRPSGLIANSFLRGHPSILTAGIFTLVSVIVYAVPAWLLLKLWSRIQQE